MNTPDLVAQSIFCEHIRQEAQGTLSLIGVMPDNININPAIGQAPPTEGQAALVPSLCIYTRIRMPLDREPRGSLSVQFSAPSGEVIFEEAVEKNFIDLSIIEAQGQGNEYVLIIQQASIANFPILQFGRYVVSVNYAGERYFSGALRISLQHT